MSKISIIMPAYNEERRIGKTLEEYISFFDALKQQQLLDFEIVVVLNGCVDNTIKVVQSVQEKFGNCVIVDLKNAAGKGLAIRAGFLDALRRPNNFIGFVDADMATSPQAFFDLFRHIEFYDGIIASRYMKGAKIHPPRPKIKRWGSWLIYESLIKLLFGLSYHDYQCGAKLFKRHTIETVTPHMEMTKWAFDVEILYLCKKFGFKIREFPTEWYDKEGSKLRMSSGFRMLASLVKLRLRHSIFRNFFT
ncbi:MAG: glycosyltransferase [Candidatus Dependentiae bacterium]|nr:glycosyltransferase [Candidatus Dependentiae bacterium]